MLTMARTRSAVVKTSGKMEKKPNRKRAADRKKRTSEKRLATSMEHASLNDENVQPNGKKRTREVADMNTTQKKPKGEVERVDQAGFELIGRDTELQRIRKFVNSHIESCSGGSLYICGSPGTGKTASLNQILREVEGKPRDQKNNRLKLCQFNGNTFQKPEDIFQELGLVLGCDAGDCTTPELARAALDKKLNRVLNKRASSRVLYLVVIDEVDQLLCRVKKNGVLRQDVLYQLFQWPSYPGSNVILVGIANSVGLHDRFLPELRQAGYDTDIMVFSAYDKDQLATVLGHRMQYEAPDIKFDTYAVELCARKIAAKTGDIRKALDVCRRAAVAGRSEWSSLPDDQRATKEKVVSVGVMLKILRKSFDCPHAAVVRDLPKLAQYALCAIIRLRRKLAKKGASKMTVQDVYSSYASMTREWDLKTLGFSEFHTLALERLGVVGLLTMKGKKRQMDVKTQTVTLEAKEDDITFVMEDNTVTRQLLTSKRNRETINMYAATK